MTLPSLIAFGAIAPWPGPDRLNQLRNVLHHHESLRPVVKAIQELPLVWKALSEQDPWLRSIAGEAAAAQLAQWTTGTGAMQNLEDRGNSTRMSLTIMTQIAQYAGYLHQHEEPLDHISVIESVRAGGGVQGFCLGLLSALAVASGKTEDDVGRFAANSVQLAFCVGAYVDLDRYHNGGDTQVSNLAVRWKAPTSLEDMQSLLSRHREVSRFHASTCSGLGSGRYE